MHSEKPVLNDVLEQLIFPINKVLETTNLKKVRIELSAFQFANKGRISRLLLTAISDCKGSKANGIGNEEANEGAAAEIRSSRSLHRTASSVVPRTVDFA